MFNIARFVSLCCLQLELSIWIFKYVPACLFCLDKFLSCLFNEALGAPLNKRAAVCPAVSITETRAIPQHNSVCENFSDCAQHVTPICFTWMSAEWDCAL